MIVPTHTDVKWYRRKESEIAEYQKCYR